MEKSKELMPLDTICHRVYTIRGQQVRMRVRSYVLLTSWKKHP